METTILPLLTPDRLLVEFLAGNGAVDDPD
jgi:hypothetical protein